MVWPYLLGVGTMWLGKKIYEAVTDDSSSSSSSSSSSADSAAEIRAKELRARRKLARDEAAASLKLFLGKNGISLDGDELESIVEELSSSVSPNPLGSWPFPTGATPSPGEDNEAAGSAADFLGSIKKSLMDQYMRTESMDALTADIDQAKAALKYTESLDTDLARLAKFA